MGLDNSGKTTLLNYLTKQDYKETRPTPGVNAESIQIKGNKINLYDLGGQKPIRKYWKYYYENVDALIYVVDTSDENRIKECNKIVQRLLKEEKLLGIPFLFYANKLDLPNCVGPDEIIEKFNLGDIKGREWSMYSCSFLKLNGVKEGMNWLLEKLKLN